MKVFLERFIYPYVVYDSELSSLFKRKISVGFIYTMSSDSAWMKAMEYDRPALFIEKVMERIFGYAESLLVNDTYQFDNYSKYVSNRFDPEEKAKIRATRFPIDCKAAFDMGVRFAGGNTRI